MEFTLSWKLHDNVKYGNNEKKPNNDVLKTEIKEDQIISF